VTQVSRDPQERETQERVLSNDSRPNVDPNFVTPKELQQVKAVAVALADQLADLTREFNRLRTQLMVRFPEIDVLLCRKCNRKITSKKKDVCSYCGAKVNG